MPLYPIQIQIHVDMPLVIPIHTVTCVLECTMLVIGHVNTLCNTEYMG